MAIPDSVMNPPMMAIGDSLFQGVRSLTMRADMFRLCPPLQVAGALGIDHAFSVPQPRRPIIVDLEQWVHDFPDLDRIVRSLKKNVAYWRSAPGAPDGRAFHENLSIASAAFVDLTGENPNLGLTWQKADDWLSENVSDDAWDKMGSLKGLIEVAKDGLNLSDLIMALNTRFTLNPMGENGLPEQKTMTPIDQVAARKPARLLVNIGSNNGLWDIAFECRLIEDPFDFTGLDTLGDQLNDLPPEVERIYFNGLGRPSTVANLMPTQRFAYYNSPRPGHYYEEYENRFGFGYNAVSGDVMAEMDNTVDDINQQVQERLRARFTNPDRLQFVDLASVLTRYDAKHDYNNLDKKIVMPDKKRLSNVTTETSPWPAPRLRRGGLFGLDGMHLTGVGSALMAQEILRRIGETEGGPVPTIDFEQPYEEDTLLDKAPRDWSYLLWIWRDIRRGLDDDEEVPDVEEDEGEDSEPVKITQIMESALRCGGRER